jgi:predicted protein tyrosine phosphatase
MTEQDFFNENESTRDYVSYSKPKCSLTKETDMPSIIQKYDNGAEIVFTSSVGAHETFTLHHGLRPIFILTIFKEETEFEGETGKKQFMAHKKIEVDDEWSARPQLAAKMEECLDFLKNAIQTDNAVVIVHCYAGISRSATIVLAHLMTHHKQHLVDAFDYVKKIRPVISPNDEFYNMLVVLDTHGLDCVEFTPA